MTVKEVIKLTALMVGEDETVSYLQDEAVNDLTYAKKVTNILLRCYNLIVEELACEYFPLKKSEKISQVINGKIYFKDLEYSPIKIVGVYDENYQKVPYKLINDYISINKPCVIVEYNYRVKPLKESDEAVYANEIIGPYVLAYGMASQYCLEKGRLNESEIFQQKYIAGIKGRASEKGSLQLPQRRWII